MKIYTAILCAMLSTACTSQNKETAPKQKNVEIIVQPTSIFETLASKANTDVEPSYDITIETIKTELGRDALLIEMNLKGGSFYVSPNAKRNYTGKFKVSLMENNVLALDSNFTETPLSVEEIDHHPFTNGKVNWVSVNTSYRYLLLPKSKQDFEAKGLVTFTIEPKCTFERIGFTISRKNGKYSVESKKDNC